jgi:hypothetical protein
MKRSAAAFWSLARGVFLTLLVGGALAPARASASCGDYVTVTNPSGPSGQSAPPAPQTGPTKPLPPSGEGPHDSPLPGPLPCRAPSCSGDPAPPAPSSSAGEDGGQERQDCLLALPTGSAAATFGLPLDDRALKPFRVPCSVFHPPRPR